MTPRRLFELCIRNLISSTLDHDDVGLVPDIDEVKIGVFALFEGGIDDKFAVDASNANGAAAKKQTAKVKGDKLTVTLPIADYAPEKLEKVKGLLYHPAGWQGSKGNKYMPVTLRLD